MDWKNRLYLGLGIILTLMPFMVDLALLLRRKEYMQLLPAWRYWMATGGLLLGMLAAIPTPVFYFALEFPGHMNGDWLMLGIARWMPEALIAGFLALVLLAFGKARVRWVGLAATFVGVAFLYVTLLGLSSD